MANVACHILQTEIYPSQTVDDNLNTALATTAASLEEDLNFIRSVIKKLHGGTTWYDVGDYSINDFVSDFQVEHYTSAEDPLRAGQHKDVHADSVTTPDVFVGNEIYFNKTIIDSTPIIDFQLGYTLYAEDVEGPSGGVPGRRLWLNGPGYQATGEETGIVFGPRAGGELFEVIRYRANYHRFELNDGSIRVQLSTGNEIRAAQIFSTGHDARLDFVFGPSRFRFIPVYAGTALDILSFDYTNSYWGVPKFRISSDSIPTDTSTSHALTLGNPATIGMKLGARDILGFASNASAPVRVNSNTSAAGQFPLRVGSEEFGVWHQGNQGHGSGLDADMLDGYHYQDIRDLFISHFQVEHYTSDEDPTRAGQHKDVHADSVTTPTVFVGDEIYFNKSTIDSTPIIDFQLGFTLYSEDVAGPLGGTPGRRLWLSGPGAQTTGEETGIVLGPRAGADLFRVIRYRAYYHWFEVNGGYIRLQTNVDSEVRVAKILSTTHNANLSLILGSDSFRLYPEYAGNSLISLKFDYTDNIWETRRFRLFSTTVPTSSSTDHALTLGSPTIVGMKLGARDILGFASNVPAPVRVNSHVSAAGQFPLRVGSEEFGVWHQGNQGHGSGLDADTLDGNHLSDITTVSGSIRATTPTYGPYLVGTIVPSTDLPTRTEPYNVEFHFKVQYKLKGLTETYWLTFVVEVVYDTSSGDWVVTSMHARTIDGTFDSYAPNLRLIHGTDIFLRKRTVTGTPNADYVDIILYTAASELDIFEITKAVPVSSQYLITKPAEILWYEATSTLASTGCTNDTCVAGKHLGHLVESLSVINGTNPDNFATPLNFGAISQSLVSLFVPPANTVNVQVFQEKRNSFLRLLSVTQTEFTGLCGTDIPAIINVDLGTSPDFSIRKIQVETKLADTALDGAYQTLDNKTYSTTVSEGFTLTSRAYSNANAYDILQSVIAQNALNSAGVNSISGVYTARTGAFYSLGTTTPIPFGGYIAQDKVAKVSFSFPSNYNGSVRKFALTSAYIQYRMGMYTFQVVDSSNNVYVGYYILSSTLTEYAKKMYQLPLGISTNVRFLIESPIDGTKGILAYVDPQNYIVKIAFLDDVSNITSLTGITVELDTTSAYYSSILASHILYPEESPGPIFLVNLLFVSGTYSTVKTIVIDGSTWNYYVIDLPLSGSNLNMNANEMHFFSKAVVMPYEKYNNGKIHIPIGRLAGISYNPVFAKLDKTNIPGSVSQFKSTRDSDVIITSGSLGISATDVTSNAVIGIVSETITPTSSSTAKYVLSWDRGVVGITPEN